MPLAPPVPYADVPLAPPVPYRTVSKNTGKASGTQDRGFTLLEIILSLAILAGSLAALGEVMRLADRNAEMVRDETQAQILAASVMDELLAGFAQMQAVNQEPFQIDSEPPWVYSIAFEETPYLELLLARVRVEQQLPPQQQPAKFELVRWLPNPDNISTTTTDESSDDSSSSSSSNSGSTTGGNDTVTQSSRRRPACVAGELRLAGNRSGFTLVELILAIALSVTLLALIGTAINLYLVRVDAGRSRVEEAQLARSILAMIADDLRATAIYKPQDTSTVASLVAASAAAFDVDSIDNPTGAGGLGGTGAPGGTSAAGTAGSATSLGAASSSASSGGTSGSVEETLPLGLNGALDELYVDTDQLPRMEELFRTNTGYTNAQSVVTATGPTAMPSTASMASASRPSNVKTVRYIVREGRSPGPESTAIASLPLDEQQEIGGLVRPANRPARPGFRRYDRRQCASRIGPSAGSARGGAYRVPLLRRLTDFR